MYFGLRVCEKNYLFDIVFLCVCFNVYTTQKNLNKLLQIVKVSFF